MERSLGRGTSERDQNLTSSSDREKPYSRKEQKEHQALEEDHRGAEGQAGDSHQPAH